MNVGDIVTSSRPSQTNQGIIVDKLERGEILNRFDTGETFVVLWHTGELKEHKSWDLLSLEGV